MRYLFFTFFLVIASLCRATGDTTFTRPTSNRYKAAEAIKALKHGALIVRLKTNDKSIAAYRNAGQNELADKIVAERAALNQKIADAFRYYLTFCKVYFIYAKNTNALLKHEPGIFLNDKLQPDTSIKLKQDYFLIAEYGSYTANERTDEYHYSGVYTTEPSASTASTSSLFISDTTLNQLQEPFPFAVPVYLGGFIKAVDQLNRQLDKVYNNFRYQEDIDLDKLKKKRKAEEMNVLLQHQIQIIDVGLKPYMEVLALQEKLFTGNLLAKEKGEPTSNYLILCEHPPVFTLGKSGKRENILVGDADLHAEFYHVNRGGDVTFHGPGQLVAYPILDVDSMNMGLAQYIQYLEETIIKSLLPYQLKGERIENAAGIWLRNDKGTPHDRKIGAIGIKASRKITMHGLAVNVNTDLSYFDKIVACGLEDKGVTSLSKELKHEVIFEEYKSGFLDSFKQVFNCSETLITHC